MKSRLFSKKGAFDAKMGVDLGLTAIFVLAIGLTIVVEVSNNLTLTGISATVLGYAPLIVVAVFIYGVARIGGVL
jgi:hypothetical protein